MGVAKDKSFVKTDKKSLRRTALTEEE